LNAKSGPSFVATYTIPSETTGGDVKLPVSATQTGERVGVGGDAADAGARGEVRSDPDAPKRTMRRPEARIPALRMTTSRVVVAEPITLST